MIQRHTFEQQTPSNVWNVEIAEPNAVMGRALAAYDQNGDLIAWDSWDFTDGKIVVNFGIDPVVGSLAYEYKLPTTKVENADSLISITTNYGDIHVSPDSVQM